MGLKPGYKQTEVGVIPEDWEVKQIGDFKPFVTSGSRGWAEYYAETGSPFIRITNLVRPSIYLKLDDLRFVNVQEDDSEAARTRLQNDDVLVSITADIGIVGYVSDRIPKPSYINQHIALVRFGSSPIHPKFVSYYLASERPQKLFRALTDSGAKAGMNLTTVQQLRLALPLSESEQEAIAEALSNTDALVESLEQLLAKKRHLKRGAMQELLTGKKRLPGFESKPGYVRTEVGQIPKDWELQRLNEVAVANWGNTAITKTSYKDTGYIAFSASGPDGFLDWYEHEFPAVILSAIGAQCGKTWLATGRWTPIKNTIWFCAKTGEADTRFLFYKTGDPSFWPNRGQAQPFIALGDVRNAIICLPSNHIEQKAIAAALSDMDAEIAALQAKLTKARQLKQGMMQELLTGRIRLVRPSTLVVPITTERKANVDSNESHNPQINEAVVIAVLASRFGTEQYPLARVRRTKLAYLLHRYAEHEAPGFLKKAAGPYDPKTRYGGPEKIALKNRYVCKHHNGTYEGFVAADNIKQAQDYFENWYGPSVLEWLEQFRYKSTEELELVSTVDMASEELRHEGRSVTSASVKQVLRGDAEWKAKLDRPIFADDKIDAAIRFCDQLFVTEGGKL
jgi:type I restriction enzyme S subunit